MRLIDADVLMARLEERKDPFVSIGYLAGLCKAQEYIDEAPTIEPKKGKWILPNDCVALYLDEWICSNCTHLISHRHNFCPNCGAYMYD